METIELLVAENEERAELEMPERVSIIHAISPTINAERTDDGVVVTVSDYRSSSQAVIHDGEDYVLTPEDKDEIANLTVGKIHIPANVSELENDAGYLTAHQDISGKADKSEIPVNVSELANDAGYLTQHQDISNKADKSEIPTRVSELENDTGYITGYTETDPTVPEWAKRSVKPSYTAAEVGALPDSTHIPSTTGELENDAGFITAEDLPVNVSELVNDAGYLTQHQDISGKADKSEIPVNVSEFTNDAGYLTTETDPTVPAWAKAAQKPAYTAAEVGATTEHQVREMIADAVPEVPVQDVQVNGASILQNGVANIPVASYSNGQASLGLVKAYGLGISVGEDGEISIKKASDRQIKTGSGDSAPVVAAASHQVTFYGLAKAAGDTTQSQSTNGVGTYTDEAKAAIQTMLDVPAKSDIPDVPVQDVQLNGTSVLYDGVANIPVAGENFGVIKVIPAYGLTTTSAGSIATYPAGSSNIKTGGDGKRPLVPMLQHESTFYGLAKAAGDTSQSVSSNTVGTYTDEAKAAIQNMLDVPSNTDLAQAISDVEEKIQHMYICSAAEYNSETGVPTVANPDSKMFYLVPSAEGSPNLYIEWVYLNNTWERFGSATIDLSNYVQFDDYATVDKAGVVKVGNGISVASNGKISFAPGNDAQIKQGVLSNTGTGISKQHITTFYGLAKAAGYDEKDSTLPVGQYTPAAQSAIRSMLGAANVDDIVAVQDTQPTSSDNKIWLPETAPEGVEVPTVAEMNAALAEKVDDVQINGASIVQNGVANVPYGAGLNTASAYGLQILSDSGSIRVVNPGNDEFKLGTRMGKPIAPGQQHYATFYGLARAAGHDEKDSTEPFGTYTPEAQTAIKNMLGVEEGLKVVRLI